MKIHIKQQISLIAVNIQMQNGETISNWEITIFFCCILFYYLDDRKVIIILFSYCFYSLVSVWKVYVCILLCVGNKSINELRIAAKSAR